MTDPKNYRYYEYSIYFPKDFCPGLQVNLFQNRSIRSKGVFFIILHNIMQNLIFFKVLACKTSNKFKLCSLKGLQDRKAFTLTDHCISISKLLSLESNQGYECKGINKLGQLDFRLFPVADRVTVVYSDRFSLNRAHCRFEQSQPSYQIRGPNFYIF